MQASSKVQAKGPAAKFSVLRPYPKILALNRSFRRPPFCQNYLYVVDQDFGLRKYSTKVDSFQQSLKEAQWRYECFAPVVRCLYVELMSADYFREGEMEIYYSHIEVNLSEFKQLIVQEAVYLIIESFKGYQALLERYRRVSVNDETIGVGSNGQVMVWINRFLEKATCQEKYLTTPSQIITQILKLVKERSQPVCSKLLTKIEDFNQKEKPSFKLLLDYIKPFLAKNNIKVPQNLKYLLHQHRIKQSFNQLQSMRVSMKGISNYDRSVSSVFNINVKSPICDTFNPSRVLERPVSNDGLLKARKNCVPLRKYSAGQSSNIGLRLTMDAPITPPSPMTPASPAAVSKNTKTKLLTQRKWSCWENDKKFFGIHPVNRLASFGEQRSISSKARVKTENEGESPIPSFLKPTNKENMKRSSGITENTKAGNSPVKRSNLSQLSDCLVDVATIKKIDRKSSIQLEELTFRDKASGCQVPTLNKFAEHPLPNAKYNFEPTFNCIPETINEEAIRETVIKGNDWTRTFKNLLDNKDEKLNISLCDGKEEVNNYLSDVKLDKLDGLSRQMVQSLLSEPSQRSIISNGSFEC